MLAHGVFSVLGLFALEVALYLLAARLGLFHVDGLARRIGSVSAFILLVGAIGGGVAGVFLSPLTLTQATLALALAFVATSGDVCRRTYIDGGVVPATLTAGDWQQIWQSRWEAHRIGVIASVGGLEDVRREVEMLVWTHQPALLLEQRELDRQIGGIELAKTLRFGVTVEDDGRKRLKEQVEQDRGQLDELRRRNELRLAEIADLLAFLPTQIFLARRDDGAAGEALDRCRAVSKAVENHRAAKRELEGSEGRRLEGPVEPPPADPGMHGRS